MKILFSNSRKATENLALEQQLLLGSEQVVLLYINDRTVVVGRNQIVEAEVDCNYCQKSGIEVVRRLSGGGAVYHDGGNLNYAIICDAGSNPLDRDYTQPIVWTLKQMGVDALEGNRGQITVEGEKISGSASMVSRGRVLFHGTLLFDSDLQMLNNALRGDESLRGKGVKSVHSTVRNLKQLLPHIPTVNHFVEEIERWLAMYYEQ